MFKTIDITDFSKSYNFTRQKRKNRQYRFFSLGFKPGVLVPLKLSTLLGHQAPTGIAAPPKIHGRLLRTPRHIRVYPTLTNYAKIVSLDKRPPRLADKRKRTLEVESRDPFLYIIKPGIFIIARDLSLL
jgi:hypothetical protein